MEDDVKKRRCDQKDILEVADNLVEASPYFDKYDHGEVRFEDSANNNFLQLADTIAYNVFRQFVHYGNDWDQPKDNILELYPYFEKMEDCFHRSPTGVIAGFGVVKIPDIGRNFWKQKKAS